jgi:hypothetical protein
MRRAAWCKLGNIQERRMKMKKYASFDEYLADQPAKNRSIIRALRRFVKRVEPELEESVKWGNGCWVKEKVPKERLSKERVPKAKAPVAYVYSAPDHIQFGFLRGSALKDPKALLEGNGQYVRHVKVRKPSDIDDDVFKAFLRQAAH